MNIERRRRGRLLDIDLRLANENVVVAICPVLFGTQPVRQIAVDRLAIVRRLTDLDFVGFDVVEVIPAYDPAATTAFLAANLAYEMLSLVALRRREPASGSA